MWANPPKFYALNLYFSLLVTEAGFALNLINIKLDGGLPQTLYIEEVKEEEEPINSGPNSVLVSYDHGWKLRTVTETKGGPTTRASTKRTAKQVSSPLTHIGSSKSSKSFRVHVRYGYSAVKHGHE